MSNSHALVAALKISMSWQRIGAALGCALVFACGGGGDGGATAPNTGTVSGTVRNSMGAGLSGIGVSVTPAGGSTLTTEATRADGSFSIGAVPQGSGTVALAAVPGNCSMPSPANYSDLRAGGSIDVQITVTCIVLTGTIAGSVSSSLGGGIPNVSVTVTPTGGSAMSAVMTAANGSYSVTGVSVGSGAGSVVVTGVPANCSNPSAAPYSGLTSGTSITVNIIASCAPQGAILVIDSLMAAELRNRNMVGGSIAIMRQGRLIYAKGYGIADSASGRRVDSRSIFRLWSVSKALTSVAVLRAVDQKKLSLTDRLFTIRSDLTLFPGAAEDSRVENITLQELLQYTPGWNALTLNPDSTNVDWKCFAAASHSADDWIRCARGVPLGADPGANQQYTSTSRLAMARMLDRVTGMPYLQYVASDLFASAGLTGISPAHSLIASRPASEVRYYPVDYWVSPGAPDIAAIEDAAGGWVGAPGSVLRFFRAVGGDGPTGSILSSSSASFFTTPPPGVTGVFLGPLGYPESDGSAFRFTGIGENTEGCMLYSFNRSGVSYVAAFNSTCDASLDYGAWEIMSDIQVVVSKISTWPTVDLFNTVP